MATLKCSFDKTTKERIDKEKEIEKILLDILKEDWDSEEEGCKGLSLEGLFYKATGRNKNLTLKDFVKALNGLSGDGLFRSKKRIRIDFVADSEVLLADELKRRRVHVIVTPR